MLHCAQIQRSILTAPFAQKISCAGAAVGVVVVAVEVETMTACRAVEGPGRTYSGP